MLSLFVLMVKAVCGESRTHGLGGGKIPNKESTYPYKDGRMEGAEEKEE